MVNSMISGIKIEVGEIALKEIVLQHFFPNDELNWNDYEGYFYLTEKFDPMFVVEQKTTNDTTSEEAA